MDDQVRIIRILEYSGERKWVEDTLARAGVPLNGQRTTDHGTIRSAMLGSFPELLKRAQVQATSTVLGVCPHCFHEVTEGDDYLRPTPSEINHVHCRNRYLARQPRLPEQS